MCVYVCVCIRGSMTVKLDNIFNDLELLYYINKVISNYYFL